MRGGDHASCEARSSMLQTAAVVADARHVHGGECQGVDCASGMAAAAEECRGAQRLVAAAGGRASRLMHVLGEAETYLRTNATGRRKLPSAYWDAYHALVAGDLPGPDWRLCADGAAGGEDAERRAREDLARKIAAIAVAVGEQCNDARCTWQARATSVVTARHEREAGRAWLRLCMRAWREIVDGRRAHEGDWERRWERARTGHGGCALAMRTQILAGCARLWKEEGWQVRVLMAWFRLVQADSVLARRPEHTHARGHVQPLVVVRQGAAGTSGDGAGAAGMDGDGALLATAQPQPQRQRVEQRGHEQDARHDMEGDEAGAAADGQQQPQHQRAAKRRHEQEGENQETRQQRQRRQQIGATDHDGAHADASEADFDGAHADASEANFADLPEHIGPDGAGASDGTPAYAPRTRRTDAVLTLRTAARARLTAHLNGRLAHARRARGDG